MASYSGRRGPNVSQYLANLNTVPSSFEMAGQNQSQSQSQNNINFDEDIALWMDAEFFDFDMGELPAMSDSFDHDPAAQDQQRSRRGNASTFHGSAVPVKQEMASLNGAEFPQIAEFSPYPNLVPNPANAPSATSTATSSTPPATLAAAPPSLSPAQPGNVYPHQHASYSAASSASPISPVAGPTQAPKRKLDALTDSTSHRQTAVDEVARVAAEEDKRRRNTAASARFRIKKKQREQALEKTAKDMTEKVSLLESRVSQLEMENKWLKSLITEKNASKGDFAEIYKKLSKDGAANESARSTGERTDGVGTSRDVAIEKSEMA